MSDKQAYGDIAKVIAVKMSLKTLAKLGSQRFEELGIDFDTPINFNGKRSKKPTFPEQEFDLSRLLKVISLIKDSLSEDLEDSIRLGFLRHPEDDEMALYIYATGKKDELEFYLSPRVIQRSKEKSP